MHKRTNAIPSPDSPLFTIPQTAAYLCVGESTVNKLVYSGELESLKVARCRRVTRASCDKYIANAAKRAA